MLLLNSSTLILLYLIVAVLTTIAFRRWILRNELLSDDKALPRLTDPYEIAYLRKGEVEAIKVATISLIDRGLLIYEGENLKALDASSIEIVNRPIEKAIITCFEESKNHLDAFQNPSVRQICREYKESLLAHRLIADKAVYKSRFFGVLIAIGLLASICVIYGFTKTLSKRTDLIVSIAVMLFFSFVIVRLSSSRLTARGNKVIRDLRFLFNRLLSRSKFLVPGGNTNEVALAAGIFGLHVLSEKSFPFINKLYSYGSSKDSKNSTSDLSVSSSTCGTCCGSGCGSGCGGGCGS